MSTKSDSFLQKVENGHSVHWIQKPRFILAFNVWGNLYFLKIGSGFYDEINIINKYNH